MQRFTTELGKTELGRISARGPLNRQYTPKRAILAHESIGLSVPEDIQTVDCSRIARAEQGRRSRACLPEGDHLYRQRPVW